MVPGVRQGRRTAVHHRFPEGASTSAAGKDEEQRCGPSVESSHEAAADFGLVRLVLIDPPVPHRLSSGVTIDRCGARARQSLRGAGQGGGGRPDLAHVQLARGVSATCRRRSSRPWRRRAACRRRWRRRTSCPDPFRLDWRRRSIHVVAWDPPAFQRCGDRSLPGSSGGDNLSGSFCVHAASMRRRCATSRAAPLLSCKDRKGL